MTELDARELFEHAPCGWVVTDGSGSIHAANPAFRGWVAAGDRDLHGVRFADLLTPGGRLYHDMVIVPRLLLGSEIREAAVELAGWRDRPLPVFLTARVVERQDGRPAAVHMAVIDASERRRYESELLAATHALQGMIEQKNRILGMVAHDLRSPLSNIIGLIELAVGDPADPSAGAYLGMARTSAEHMLVQIRDLLDATAAEDGRLRCVLADGDLRIALTHAIDSAGRAAAGKSSRVGYLPPETPLRCAHDPARIDQALGNLIGNAIKFSPPGSVIEVTAGLQDGAIAVAVADRGPGIPPEEIDNLFQPFATGSARPTAGERSTGLGLAITRRIVEAHSGSITVRPRAGGGSVFEMVIPAVS
jgi:PAS domain S-box-containing protein